MSKYSRTIRCEDVDVYDVLKAFNVTCPARAHAIKKLLMPGARGAKDELQDITEAREALDRAFEMASE